MDEIEVEAEYNNYWETKRFYEELDNSWEFDETLYDSSSPEGPASASSAPADAAGAAKNIAMERNRRRKVNDKLYALRSVVPNISKMDKVSIVKDAIDYVLELQQEERRMMTEVAELEKSSSSSSSVNGITQDDRRCKKRRRSSIFAPESPGKPFIEVAELRVCEVGERTQVVSITCNKKEDTMIRVCELFETLNLKIVSANITSVCGSLLHTLFVEADDMTTTQLKEKIEAAIAEYDAMTKAP